MDTYSLALAGFWIYTLMAAGQFDPNIFQAALLQVAEATTAAAAAAQSAAASASAASSGGAGSGGTAPSSVVKANVDWSKLLNKPSTFGEGKSVEDDVKAWRDYQWQLHQYLVAIDEGYDDELKKLTTDPSVELPMDTASVETRNRSNKLYSLLASLMKNRCLAIVKSTASGNGFEALRQLILALRPPVQNRGLALLTAITSWQPFGMQKPLLPQLLVLEEAYEEARKSGMALNDELRSAILLRCIGGQLKTHLNMALTDSAKYSDLREQVLKWDRAQAKWSQWMGSQETDAQPMEIDRVEGKGGWNKGKGQKGKGKSNKGFQKGKGKGGKSPGKSKDGKSKSWDKGGKAKGKTPNDKGKGKGNSGEKYCYSCGGLGHFARDCWNAVRSAQVGTTSSPSSTVNTGEWSHLTSVSQQQQGQGSQQSQVSQQPQSSPKSTQYKVARIAEEFHANNDASLVFDLRSSLMTQDANICVIHYFIGDDDTVDLEHTTAEVRTVIQELPDHSAMHNILLDSGADASVFPMCFASAGEPSYTGNMKLHDAQGKQIPVAGMRDVEIALLDEHGRLVTFRERGAVSPGVSQPIICFGKLLENGWGVDGIDQTLNHATSGTKIPIELQNKSMVVRGWVRAIGTEPQLQPEVPTSIRAVKASVLPSIEQGAVGWHLDQFGLGIGRHYSSHFQDPSLMVPGMHGERFRTTLVKDGNDWYCLELCEKLTTLVDLAAPFHDFEGERSVLTFISDGEKDPRVLGFVWADDDVLQFNPAAAGSADDDVEIVAPEDMEVQGADIEVGEDHPAAGVEIQEKILVEPLRDDKLVVNGVELTMDSTLAALRAGLTFYNLSTSGSKQKCFTRLANHQKQQELEIITAAANQAQREDLREPQAPKLAVPPSEKEQQQHALTHLPFADWCPSCVCHRSRQDRHMVDGSARRSGVPTISFDFCHTRAVPEGVDPARAKPLTALVMVCSQTGYVHCTPVKNKNQFELMTRELISFAQLLGHSQLEFMCDNEPTMRTLLRMAVNTRLAMGLPTRANTPPAYSHGNSLVENAIGRIRPLAGSLMHALGQKVGMEFSTSNPLWTWALRHSCWLMNRFNANKGLTSFELITNKPYRGGICQFGEPVYGYSKSNNKGSARWSRMIFLGKVDPQDSFILYNGVNLVLVKSIRRIQTDWRGHLAFYVNFKCSSFDYKSGFGGRVVPTKANRSAVGASFNQPQGTIQPSAFYDEDGAAVIEKAKEEKREELESSKMALWDRPEKVEEELIELPAAGTYPNPTDIWGEGEDEPTQVAGEPASGHADVPLAVPADDDVVGVPNPSLRLDAPSTPIDLLAAPSTPPSPRVAPTTRIHDAEVEEEHSTKRFKEEPHKKARLTRLSEERNAMVRAVKIADDEFYTMDSYDEDPQLDDHCDYGDPWIDEDKVTASGMPEELWYDGDTTVQPPTPPSWIDRLADKVEIQRLCNMGVLMLESEYGTKVESKLTTRFVYDWRLKDYAGPDNNEPSRKRWLRRSRCVAREYAFLERREDTFAPASSTHVLNILPVLWLQKAADFEASKGTDSGCEWLLATLDVKDAFLMVPQPEVLKIRVGSENYIVLRNLPGQRQGARSWYWHLRKWLDDAFKVEWCLEQPCLCRGNNFCLLTHVDDILYCGSRQFWNDVFLPTFKKSFTVSYSMLEGVGSEISFLKRKIQRLENGLALIPGTNIDGLCRSLKRSMDGSGARLFQVTTVCSDKMFQLSCQVQTAAFTGCALVSACT